MTLCQGRPPRARCLRSQPAGRSQRCTGLMVRPRGLTVCMPKDLAAAKASSPDHRSTHSAVLLARRWGILPGAGSWHRQVKAERLGTREEGGGPRTATGLTELASGKRSELRVGSLLSCAPQLRSQVQTAALREVPTNFKREHQ